MNPETVKVLKANNARWLTEFEETDRQEHPGEERSHAASGAVRHPGLKNAALSIKGRSLRASAFALWRGERNLLLENVSKWLLEVGPWCVLPWVSG